jgi:hypothetical protein
MLYGVCGKREADVDCLQGWGVYSFWDRDGKAGHGKEVFSPDWLLGSPGYTNMEVVWFTLTCTAIYDILVWISLYTLMLLLLAGSHCLCHDSQVLHFFWRLIPLPTYICYILAIFRIPPRQGTVAASRRILIAPEFTPLIRL